MVTDKDLNQDILNNCRWYSGEDDRVFLVDQSLLDRLTTKTRSVYSGSSCGKCILSGEHSVVYGGWCVCSPLRELEVKVSLWVYKEKEHNTSKDKFFLTEVEGENHSILKKMFTSASRLLNVEIGGDIVLGVESSFPLGAGLGGSAALSSALIDALLQYSGKQISTDLKLQLCNELEKINHLSPSGVDSYVVVKKEVIWFKKNEKKIPIKINQDKKFSFLLIDSMQRSKTRDMIEKVKDYFKSSSLISEFDRCSQGVKQALESKDMDLMQNSLNGAGSLLRSIGLYTEELISMDTSLKELGVAAVKPTGACGGGMMLVLLDPRDPYQEDKIRGIYEDRGIFKFFL